MAKYRPHPRLVAALEQENLTALAARFGFHNIQLGNIKRGQPFNESKYERLLVLGSRIGLRPNEIAIRDDETQIGWKRARGWRY
jgi:hypothetical protein